MPSSAYRSFLHSLDAERCPRDGIPPINIAALGLLDVAEQDRARSLLLKRYGETHDGRIPAALGALGPDEGAIDVLMRALDSASPLFQLDILDALDGMNAAGTNRTKRLRDMLRTENDPLVLVEVLGRLQRTGSLSNDPRVRDLLTHSAPFLRVTAAKALLEEFGVLEYVTPKQTRLGQILSGLTLKFRRLNQACAMDLLAVLDGLSSGATISELGLDTPVNDRECDAILVELKQAGSGNYSVGPFKDVSPDTRAWGRMVLAQRVQEKDVRAVATLVALSDQASLELLEDAPISKRQSAFSEIVQNAVERLGEELSLR